MERKEREREREHTPVTVTKFSPRVHFALLYAHVVAAVSVTRDIS